MTIKKKKKKNSYKTWTWLQTPTMNWYQHNIFSSFKLLLLIWIVFDEKYPQLTAGVHCPGWLKHRLATDTNPCNIAVTDVAKKKQQWEV